jgi:hypothetical protein
MQTQYVLKQAGLTLPVTKLFQQHIATLLAEQSQQTSVRAVVINFRDPDYSAESGGFHPVEMRFIRQDNEWYFDYVTDFSYMGRVYPELEKEIDFCWSGHYVFHYLMEIFHWQQRGMNSGPCGRVILWNTCLWGFTG